MIIRSKAPLRLGLAGGGSDVSPYSDLFGGAILNATINKFAYATLIPHTDGKIILNSVDRKKLISLNSTKTLKLDGTLDLVKGIYNRIVKDFTNSPLSFELITHVDAPPGSGLGSSSTLVIAILGAFSEWLKLPLGEYDLANLAYQIERIDLEMAGGKQDQYAATFGGVNFMEFYKDEKVIVNPLRIKEQVTDELAYKMVLFNTESSRFSSTIINEQVKNVKEKKKSSVDAMHNIKKLALQMKEALLKNELDKIGRILHSSWHYKREMAENISNPALESIYERALKAGATGGKISGAGGGGYMFFYCPGNTRHKVIEVLNKNGGHVQEYEFTKTGLKTWEV